MLVKFIVTGCLLAFTLATAGRATASALVTVSYSGEIRTSNIPGIATGALFTGILSYHTAAPAEVTPDPALLLYLQNQPADSLELSTSGFVFSVTPAADSFGGLIMAVTDGPDVANPTSTIAEVSAGSISQTAAPHGSTVFSTNYSGLFFTQLDVQLFGNSNFLQSTALPDPFDAADLDFNSPFLTVTSLFVADGPVGDPDTSVFVATGAIRSASATSQSLSSAPEPGTWLLLATGLAGCAWKRLRAF